MEFRNLTKENVNLILLQEENETLFAIAPDHGAKLTSLRLKAAGKLHELLWPVSVEDLKSNSWYKSTILFPYPNRLENGKYAFGDKTYQFPINEPDKNNQLHGMVYDAPFEVTDQKINSDGSASISCRHAYDGHLDYFPFPFELVVTYSYRADRFEVEFSVTNTGTSVMPFGLGWHPYFQIDGHRISKYQVRLPKTDLLELGKTAIPTGSKEAYPHREIDLNATKLDNAFRITDDSRSYELHDQGSGLRIAMSASEAFDYLQIFTPPGDEAVAIEPMTCNINAFNNKEGLRELEPSKEFKGQFRMVLLKFEV